MKPKLVICGVEHSGTTLLSDIFRQVEGMDSGFEVGVLLANSARDFRALEPFVGNLVSGWGVRQEDLNYICDVETFEDFYSRLCERSSVIAKDCEIFDKTPRYFADLGKCRRNFNGPIVATYKDPRSIVYSDFKRSKEEHFNVWYKSYMPRKKEYLQRIYSNYLAAKSGEIQGVLPISLENICLNTRATVEKVFAHVGIVFSVQYLLLKNLRYAHTKAPYVASNIPFEYVSRLGIPQQNKIKEDFSCLADWFYPISDEDAISRTYAKVT